MGTKWTPQHRANFKAAMQRKKQTKRAASPTPVVEDRPAFYPRSRPLVGGTGGGGWTIELTEDGILIRRK